MVLSIQNLFKRYGTKEVLKNINFTVDLGDIVSIIGPSGAGKTTLLKLIAGIEYPDEGQILFDEEPSKQNPVILVFQDYILFPNLTVFENIAFGLRARNFKDAPIRDKVHQFLEYFGIPDKAESYPNQLDWSICASARRAFRQPR
jgi:putative spermidine/putrescine transport system ATP-binding protein